MATGSSYSLTVVDPGSFQSCIVSGGEEQIIQLSNGCLCCGIRDDLRATLADLAGRRRAGEIAFDQVMIETTGLADPGPIAQTFFLDPQIAGDYLRHQTDR